MANTFRLSRLVHERFSPHEAQVRHWRQRQANAEGTSFLSQSDVIDCQVPWGNV
jgi:hypothetical protein